MIHYKEGYKYILTEDSEAVQTIFRPDEDIRYGFITLSKEGILMLLAGFPFDGPSGPTYDTPDSMQGSGYHDAIYTLMGNGLLPLSCKDAADKLLRDTCIADGMPHWRAEAWHEAVKYMGAGHIAPDLILTAP